MPRLRNSVSGVVVSCSDETAASLPTVWEPIQVPALQPTRKRAPGKAASKTTTAKG